MALIQKRKTPEDILIKRLSDIFENVPEASTAKYFFDLYRKALSKDDPNDDLILETYCALQEASERFALETDMSEKAINIKSVVNLLGRRDIDACLESEYY